MRKNWIKGAIKRPGAFSAKAKRAGMSTAAFANKTLKKNSKASTLTKEEANLYKELRHFHNGHKAKRRK